MELNLRPERPNFLSMNVIWDCTFVLFVTSSQSSEKRSGLTSRQYSFSLACLIPVKEKEGFHARHEVTLAEMLDEKFIRHRLDNYADFGRLHRDFQLGGQNGKVTCANRVCDSSEIALAVDFVQSLSVEKGGASLANQR